MPAELPRKDEGDKRKKKKSTSMTSTNLKLEVLAREAGVRPNSVQQILLRKNGNALGMGIVAAKVGSFAEQGPLTRRFRGLVKPKALFTISSI